MKVEVKNKHFVKPTGATKRSISVNSNKVGRFKYKVAPGTAYAAYVELGTRKMSAQPFIKPAFDDQKKNYLKTIWKGWLNEIKRASSFDSVFKRCLC